MENTATLHLEMKTPQTSEPMAKAILEQAQQKMGMIPNMYGLMANAPGLLQAYTQGYELFRKHSGFTPVEQEVVLLSISFENGCEYCMAAHSFIADKQSKVPVEVTEAIRNGAEVPDARLRALSEFTRTLVNKRGRPAKEDVERFREGGYTEAQILQIILAIGVKTFSNYANHVCDTPVDAPFAGRSWKRPGAAVRAAV